MILKDLNNKLNAYIFNHEDPIANYELGLEYFKINETASAVSYFLRAAERAKDILLSYECLIYMGRCFDYQGDRYDSVTSCYRKAIKICPERPEAYYFLSRYCNWHSKYDEVYLLVNFAYKICNFDLQPIINLNYLSKIDNYYNALKFEQIISSWWWGEPDTCQEIILYLKENCKDLNDFQKSTILEYEKKLKSFDQYHKPIAYDRHKHQLLRHKFKGSEDLKDNYSQVFQDIFVLSMTDGKKNGFFLEIGSARPYYGNNTALLEEKYGWYGIAVEMNGELAKIYSDSRPNIKMVNDDATSLNYKNLLDQQCPEKIIDYLQLDIDPPVNTYQALLQLPLDEYKCRVITYEHDYYVDAQSHYRDYSRSYLKNLGYVLVAPNISPDGKCSFEDWWVHPDLIDPEILNKMLIDDNGKPTDCSNYIYGGEKLASFPTQSTEDKKNKMLSKLNLLDITPQEVIEMFS